MCDISPVKIDINADLTKPAEDITGMAKDTHKGVCKFFYALLGPWIEERIGKAKRGAAQAEKDSLDILASHATKTMISIGNVSSVDALCEELEKANSQCKAKRLAAALMAASIEMKQVPEVEVSDEPLNQTFFNHWRAEAELIDDDDLRQWWAHLLVEETKKPNSISSRTLDAAKNLTKLDADLFIKVSCGIIGDAILSGKDGHPINGNYGEILVLQDARLVGYQSSTKSIDCIDDLTVNGKCSYIFSQDNNIAICFKKEKIYYSCYVLTTAGREIHRTFKEKRSLDDFIKIANEISRQNNNVETFIYQLNPLSKNENNETTYGFAPSPIWTNKKSDDKSGENK